jgi:hypothetical protein
MMLCPGIWIELRKGAVADVAGRDRGVALLAGGRAGLDWARSHPDLLVVILAPSWQDLDEIRGLIAQAGVAERVKVHHRSAAAAAERAGYRIVDEEEAA